MTETPDERVARLQSELAQAEVDAVRPHLADAEQSAQSVLQQVRRHRGQDRGGGQDSGSPASSQLAAAPRHVPFAYRLVFLNFNMWLCFAMLFCYVPWFPFLTRKVPIAGLTVGLLVLVGFLGWRLWKGHVRHAVLRWGAQADVTGSELLSQGSYMSGASVQGTRMSQAHGWKVTRKMYSGPLSKTRINYRLNGTQASLILRGLPYEDGVVLADTRKPSRALCVSSFPYDVEPDSTRNWPGKVRVGTAIGSIVMTIYTLAWGGGVVPLYLHYR